NSLRLEASWKLPGHVAGRIEAIRLSRIGATAAVVASYPVSGPHGRIEDEADRRSGHNVPGVRMICPTCGTSNPNNARFCIEWGQPLALPQTCPVCGAGNPQEARFCNQCGSPLSGAPATSEARTAVPEPIAAGVEAGAPTVPTASPAVAVQAGTTTAGGTA